MTVRTLKPMLIAVATTLALVACGDREAQVSSGGTTDPAGAGAQPSGGGSDDSAGVTSGARVTAVRPTGGDAPLSSDDAAGGSATTQARGVDGMVSDQQGNPVTGALVTPTSLDTPSKAIPEVAVFTNAEGRFGWVLPAGRYRITVKADGYQEASAETEVPENGTATVDLKLSKP